MTMITAERMTDDNFSCKCVNDQSRERETKVYHGQRDATMTGRGTAGGTKKREDNRAAEYIESWPFRSAGEPITSRLGV